MPSLRSVILAPESFMLKCSNLGQILDLLISSILMRAASWRKSAVLLYCGFSLTNVSICSTKSRFRLTPL